jgi:hypothetical protein
MKSPTNAPGILGLMVIFFIEVYQNIGRKPTPFMGGMNAGNNPF